MKHQRSESLRKLQRLQKGLPEEEEDLGSIFTIRKCPSSDTGQTLPSASMFCSLSLCVCVCSLLGIFPLLPDMLLMFFFPLVLLLSIWTVDKRSRFEFDFKRRGDSFSFFFDYYVISESPEAHSCAPNKTLQQSLAATATAKVPINVLSAIKDVLRRGMKATSVGGARRQRQLRQQQEGQRSRRGNDDSSPAETKCLRRSFVRA